MIRLIRFGSLSLLSMAVVLGIAGCPKSQDQNAATLNQASAQDQASDPAASNLAPATVKATTLPLPATLSGVSVDILNATTTLSAPIYFISPGQINVQMPFDAPVGSVQVRVRTAARVAKRRRRAASPAS